MSDVLKETPPTPEHLNQPAQEKFKEIATMLVKAGRLKEFHIPALSVMADNFAQWEWACKEIERKNEVTPGSGYKQIYQTGAENLSVELSIKRDAEKALMQFFKQFGIDPKSEKDLNHVEKEDKEDFFTKFQKQKESN